MRTFSFKSRHSRLARRNKKRSVPFCRRNLRFSVPFRFMLATIVEVCGGITAHLTWKSSKTSCLQEKETLTAKTALRGWPNIAAHISHKCLLFSPRPRTSIGILWDLQVGAARGNRNICVLTSKVLKHANPCLLAFRIKLFPIGCRMGCIVPADWLIPFSATYASYLYELRKKVW